MKLSWSGTFQNSFNMKWIKLSSHILKELINERHFCSVVVFWNQHQECVGISLNQSTFFLLFPRNNSEWWKLICLAYLPTNNSDWRKLIWFAYLPKKLTTSISERMNTITGTGSTVYTCWCCVVFELLLTTLLLCWSSSDIFASIFNSFDDDSFPFFYLFHLLMNISNELSNLFG